MGVGRLVGRTQQLSWLGEAVDRARSGFRTVAVVEGEAGLGKSRLLTEAVAAFRTPKDLVGMGFGIEMSGGELPYGVATELIRTLVRDAGVEQVREAAGAYVPALAPLCPDLRPDGDVEATRARVFPAFVSTIERLASDRLVWLLVDDLPWVDDSSRDLLYYLVRTFQAGQLMVVVTVRTHDPATDPEFIELVDRLAVVSGVERIGLSPLAPDDVAQLVSDLSAGSVTDEQTARIVAAVRGNPLMTEQWVAVGVDNLEGEVDIANPMLSRIQQLDEGTLRLVQLAAIGEGHLLHRLLKEVYGRSEPGFDTAVDRALGLRLLQYGTAAREFSFTHSLIREAADRTLTPGDRLRAHRRWGEVLSTPEIQRNDARLIIACAHHWAATDERRETFSSAVRAAQVLENLGAYGQTADLLTRAWTLWDMVDDAEARFGATKDDLLMNACVSFDAADRSDEAVVLLDRELRQPESESDSLRRLCLQIYRAQSHENATGEVDERVQVEAVTAAERILSAPSSELILLALHELGWFLRWSDPNLSLRAHTRALELTRQLNHSSSIATAGGVLIDELSSCGRFDEASAIYAEIADEVVASFDSIEIAIFAAASMARAGQLRQAAAASMRAMDRLPSPELAPRAWAFIALRALPSLLASGEWDQVSHLLKEYASINLEDRLVSTYMQAQTALFSCLRGDLEKARQISMELADGTPAHEASVFLLVRIGVRHAAAETALALGEHMKAREHLHPLLDQTYVRVTLDLWEQVLLAAKIEADMAETNGPDARSDEVAQWIRLVAEHFPRAGALDEPRRLHLDAELARGGFQDTPDQWSGAREMWRSVEHVPNTAWAALHQAEALVRSDDRAAAADPLREAWEIAERLGAVPLRDRAVDLAYRARIPIEQRPGQSHRGSLGRLTERELEVLRHLVAGESNAEIAESLFISPKTASVHVSRILTKLDVTSRGKAAAIAIREGINDSPIDNVE